MLLDEMHWKKLMMATSLELSRNTTALAGQDSLALVVVDQNEGSADSWASVVVDNVIYEVTSGGTVPADMLINSSKGLQDDLRSLGLDIKQHADNIKSLKAQKNILEDSIIDKQVLPGNYHSSAIPSTEDYSLSNGGEEETNKRIPKHDKSVIGLLRQFKTRHGTLAPVLALSKDVIGIVASLGKVDNENLSRLLSEYLGVETMLTIVCKTRAGIQALETYDKEGSIDKSSGLHGLGSSIGRISNGRHLIICLEDLRPYAGDFVADDPQRRLDLIKPRLPNGECPPGFLGFAVNMVNINTTHIFCLTSRGHGIRETLFYQLFSRTQVYSTRLEMLRALPCISGGAVSLDGGMIRGPGVYYLGNREEADVRFPVPLENQIRDLKRKRAKLIEDLQVEQQMMNQAKLNFKGKKQELLTFLGQSSS